jgi:hypothetical protein
MATGIVVGLMVTPLVMLMMPVLASRVWMVILFPPFLWFGEFLKDPSPVVLLLLAIVFVQYPIYGAILGLAWHRRVVFWCALAAIVATHAMPAIAIMLVPA